MFRKKREIPDLEKLNLVPIMDAVFIFIFFLLFSAQFIKIYEIETNAPIVSEVPSDEKLEKDPLNLVVKIYERKLELLKGIDQEIFETYFTKDENYKEELKAKLIEVRKQHPNDDYIILSPISVIPYKEIIKIIDIAQKIPKGEKIILDTKRGKKVLTKIFSQLVLEPLDEN